MKNTYLDKVQPEINLESKDSLNKMAQKEEALFFMLVQIQLSTCSHQTLMRNKSWRNTQDLKCFLPALTTLTSVKDPTQTKSVIKMRNMNKK